MNFPAYVPAVVQAYIAARIEGGDFLPRGGLAASLERAEKKLVASKSKIAELAKAGEDADPWLLRQRVKHKISCDQLAADVDCLQRLAHDRRMREVYSALTALFTDEQLRGFIYSAWSARMNYAPYRQRLNRATQLTSDIAKTAAKLAGLLREMEEESPDQPAEFGHIPSLLERTENSRDDRMWRWMRPHVLGLLPEHEAAKVAPLRSVGEPITVGTIQVVTGVPGEEDESVTVETGELDPAEQARRAVRYAWGVSPSLWALLDTVARAARAFRPRETGMIGAAVSSRKRNPKTEYLRAFVSLLRDDHGLKLTVPIMKAMAAISNVIINDPDVDVSFDDVRKVAAGGPRSRRRGSARGARR